MVPTIGYGDLLLTVAIAAAVGAVLGGFVTFKTTRWFQKKFGH